MRESARLRTQPLAAGAQETGPVEVLLLAGDVWFGDERLRIRTLLGSCVAITLWHPRRRFGGMCHFVVPHARYGRAVGAPRDGRYADEAVDLLLEETIRRGTAPREYVVKMFGGGRQFAAGPLTGVVAARNVETGKALLSRHGLTPASMHVGGSGRRTVVLDNATGDVWMHHVDHLAPRR